MVTQASQISELDAAEKWKQSDVGLIPADWSVVALGDLYDIRAGGDLDKPSFSRECSSNHPHPIYANAHKNGGLYGYSTTYQYPAPAITVTARGEIGYAIDRYHPFTAIGRLLVLSPKVGTNIKWVTEYINSKIKFAIESTGVPQLTAPQIARYQVALPTDESELESTQDTLFSLDALVEALEQLIAKKRQIKQGAMQELLSGNRRLPGFDGEWKEVNLGRDAILKARIGWQGLTTAEYLSAGDYYLITGTEILNGRVDWLRCWYVDRIRYDQDRNIQIQIGDVLVTKDGTIGKVAYVENVPSPATLNSGVFVIRAKANKFDQRFLSYILMSSLFEDFLRKLSAGSTISHLYQKDFIGFTFRVPPTNKEQRMIANQLADLDAELSILEVKLSKARQIKEGIMQELLTGRIRLV